MRFGTAARVAGGIGVVVASISMWCDGGVASAAPPGRHVMVKMRVEAGQNSSVITLPAKPPPYWPASVALSPNGRWLAVAAGNYLVLVRDTRTNRWARTIQSGTYAPVRWHPSRPVFIAPGGSADKPDFNIISLSSGKVRQLFRGDPYAFAWTGIGMVYGRWGIVDFRKSGYHGVVFLRSRYRIPWDYGDEAEVQYISPSGPNDRLAAEIESTNENKGGPPRWMEMYRKVPGRRQWVRTGRVEAKVKGRTISWYPRNPIWLGNGRLVYLRIYPAQWTHSKTSSGKLVPQYLTAKNRAELWMCSANGSRQRKITTLWDLRVFEEIPSADWITIDRQGTNVYYLSGTGIRKLGLSLPT